MKILIYGFGRMGLTHFSILNSLVQNANFTIVEPNNALKFLLKGNLKADIHKNDFALREPFDLTLITTPPFIHSSLLESSIKRGDDKIFIEKPFGGHLNFNKNNFFLNKKIFIGYVLRFNPCIQWLKSNILRDDIKSINGQYLSNTIENKPKGWRNGNYSGVLNEMGSHIIDLIGYILNDFDFTVVYSKNKSIISDVDDVVESKLKTTDNIDISIYLNWVNRNIRKPVFSLEIELRNNNKLFIDQQIIKHYDSNGILINKISSTDICESIPFYLRGVDFTKQIQNLLHDTSKMCTYEDALAVNLIMKKIYK